MTFGYGYKRQSDNDCAEALARVNSERMVGYATIASNDVKKGARILLSNGWFGTMMDNRRGTIRLAEVEGYCTDIGSVYAHDIAWAKIGDAWCKVVPPKASAALQRQLAALGM